MLLICLKLSNGSLPSHTEQELGLWGRPLTDLYSAALCPDVLLPSPHSLCYVYTCLFAIPWPSYICDHTLESLFYLCFLFEMLSHLIQVLAQISFSQQDLLPWRPYLMVLLVIITTALSSPPPNTPQPHYFAPFLCTEHSLTYYISYLFIFCLSCQNEISVRARIFAILYSHVSQAPRTVGQ